MTATEKLRAQVADLRCVIDNLARSVHQMHKQVDHQDDHGARLAARILELEAPGPSDLAALRTFVGLALDDLKGKVAALVGAGVDRNAAFLAYRKISDSLHDSGAVADSALREHTDLALRVARRALTLAELAADAAGIDKRRANEPPARRASAPGSALSQRPPTGADEDAGPSGGLPPSDEEDPTCPEPKS